MNSKLNAAKKAAELIEDRMVIGIGSGKTVELFLRELGKRIKAEGLKIWGVPSSHQSHMLAAKNGIIVVDLFQFSELDLCVDGADQVDLEFNCIKGGGAALTREKIVALASKELAIVVESSKLVEKLSLPVPVEIIPFAYGYAARKIKEIGGKVMLRYGKGKVGPIITDNGNFIADCDFGVIEEPEKLEREIDTIAGVLESGIFPARIIGRVIVGSKDGARIL
jgi:ribose 5-phosphate isomerase A